MKLFEWVSDRVKKLHWIDIKLIVITGICTGLILAKLIPSLLTVSIWWFVAITVLCLLRIYYVILFKK